MATSNAYIIGAGIGSLSAAVLLIRDGGFQGRNIRIMEELPLAGGCLDGSGDPAKGYVTRGGRMLEEEAYQTLWNLLESIPSLENPDISVRQDSETGMTVSVDGAMQPDPSITLLDDRADHHVEVSLPVQNRKLPAPNNPISPMMIK